MSIEESDLTAAEHRSKSCERPPKKKANLKFTRDSLKMKAIMHWGSDLNTSDVCLFRSF